MKFDKLPANEEDRVIALQKNDAKLLDVLRQTPSPFYTLIYTSSEGEAYDWKGVHRKQKYWDIFSDIVRQKRDPRNRALWKQHLERQKKELSDEPVSRLPPRAEYMREKEKKEKERKEKKEKEEREERERDKDVFWKKKATASGITNWIKELFKNIEWEKYDRLFSDDVVLGIVVTNIAILGIYLCFNLVKGLLVYIGDSK